jgi:hypothetical protein
MSTITVPRMSANRHSNLSALALSAARELDIQLSEVSGSSSGKPKLSLAQELRRLFPDRGRPNLPPESIGLVCGVVEDWSSSGTEGGYNGSTKAANEIAAQLEKPELSQEQIEKLIQFCLRLYYATQAKPVMNDIPEGHDGFVSMC